MTNRGKELTEAILRGDIEALKDMREQAKPVVIAFAEPGQTPVSYYVSGVGLMDPAQYAAYLNQTTLVERRGKRNEQ